MNAQPAKPVTAQRLIATATACGYLQGVNPKTKAQASKLADALVGVDLTPAQIHTLAWVLGGRRADGLASIMTQIRASNTRG
ncbi:MAG TPA: hypothetical protein VGL75_09095 [Acidothermaceae bacterium]|jgi:hypothetical protein